MKSVQFTGEESPKERERMAYDSGIDMPEGYTRVSTVNLDGFIFVAVAGKDLPAMMFVPKGEEMVWARMFSNDLN